MRILLSTLSVLSLALIPQQADAQITSTSIEAQTKNIEQIQTELQPYGAQLFHGQLSADRSTGLNDDYRLQIGDTVNLALWGAVQFNEALPVDSQGNIFIPEVGPVSVQNVALSELNQHIEDAIEETYRSGVEVYTFLDGTQPLSVFVTGSVKGPGRYSGIASDTILHYLDRAGGVDPQRGSYRTIQVKRDDRVVAEIDLYDFLKNGDLPDLQLQEGDTILVKPQLTSIAAVGEVKSAYRYELKGRVHLGQDLMDLAAPYPDVTHVAIEGVRDGAPYLNYLNLQDFRTSAIRDGDRVSFQRGTIGDSLTLEIDGQHKGQREMVVPIGTKLVDILDYIPVDPQVADLDAVHLMRQSVAKKQKDALLDSIDRLEKKALSTQTTRSVQDASDKEAQMAALQNFIARARTVEPEGRVVVYSEKGLENIMLENGDRVIIPAKSSLVVVNGEVQDPKALVHQPGLRLRDYIAKAGGYTTFGDKDNILVMRPNGETLRSENTEIRPGDEIIVLPKIPLDKLSLTREIIDVIYKATIAAAVPFTID